eukprot:8842348-Lingulodinium_polyedra.AAC.1
MTRNTNTANAHPGRMPELGSHAGPGAPSMRSRRAAAYADTHGPASQSGTPARRSAGPTDPKGMRSK